MEPSTKGPGWGARATAGVLLVLVLVVGVLGGVLVDRLVLRPAVARAAETSRADTVRTSAADRGQRDRERGRERYVGQLTRELGLSAAQRAQVDTITRVREARMQALIQEVHPRFHALIEQTRAEIDSVLTPAQREKLSALREQHQKRERAERGDSAHDTKP